MATDKMSVGRAALHQFVASIQRKAEWRVLDYQTERTRLNLALLAFGVRAHGDCLWLSLKHAVIEGSLRPHPQSHAVSIEADPDIACVGRNDDGATGFRDGASLHLDGREVIPAGRTYRGKGMSEGVIKTSRLLLYVISWELKLPAPAFGTTASIADMKKTQFESKFSGAGLSFQPLYQQVRERLTQHIVEQRWRPGEMLPSEFRLADELGVSQGTVRKALGAMTEQGVLSRRQGVGTFVSEHTGHSALYRFFPLVADGGTPELPTSEVLSLERDVSDAPAASALALAPHETIIRMRRRRYLAGECCLLETVYLPESFFRISLKPVTFPTRSTIFIRRTTG